MTTADLDRIEALAKAVMDNPQSWDAIDAHRAAADPATVLELVRLARIGMDQEATSRAQYSVPEQPQWRGLSSADPASR